MLPLIRKYNLLIFALLSQQRCSQNYISDISNGDDHKEKKMKTLFIPSLKKKKSKNDKKNNKLPFPLGLNHAGILGSILPSLSASLPGLGELEHDEKSYSSVIWLEDKEERSLKKVSSQGAHN